MSTAKVSAMTEATFATARARPARSRPEYGRPRSVATVAGLAGLYPALCL